MQSIFIHDHENECSKNVICTYDFRVRYDAVLIYKRRTEIWKDADFDTLPRPGDAFSN